MIRRRSEPETETQIQLPARRHVEIDSREDLVLLLRRWVQATYRA
jgi:hypothetical protein